MAIQTDGFKNSQGITLNFQPWFANGFRFTHFEIEESLGGQIAGGSIEMIHAGSSSALNLLENEKTGKFTLSDENGNRLEFPVIINKVDHFNNMVTLSFVCLPTMDFVNVRDTQIYETPIQETIEALYPGKVDIRPQCFSDLQIDPIYYQNEETQHDLCTRLCYSYKKDCVFSFGIEGLTLKDTCCNMSSWLKKEPHLNISIDTMLVNQRNSNQRPWEHPLIYKKPINVWEDSEVEVAIKDYTDYESLNLRVLAKMDKRFYMSTDYYQLHENLTYNRDYMTSEFFHNIIITNRDIPKYRIGDVLIVDKIQMREAGQDWPWKYYLVLKNEIFLAIDNSGYYDEDAQSFGWTSKLVALDEEGHIVLGKEQDPLEGVTV